MLAVWTAVLSVVCARSVLQLTDRSAPLSLSRVVSVSLDPSPCVGLWKEFTVTGWFLSPGAVLLLAVHTAGSAVHMAHNSDLCMEASIGRTQGNTAVRVVNGDRVAGWTFVMLGVGLRKAELCVQQWKGPLRCVNSGLEGHDAPELHLRTVTVIKLGGENEDDAVQLSVLNVAIASAVLSIGDTEEVSMQKDCPADCQVPCALPSLCPRPVSFEHTSIQSVCRQPSDSLLSSAYEYRFGLLLFGSKQYTFTPTFATKRVSFSVRSVTGDADLTVYKSHYFQANELLGKADEIGDDLLVFDESTEGLEAGISWLTEFNVKITGKGWVTGYVLTFKYEFEPVFAGNGGNEGKYSVWQWGVIGGMCVAAVVAAGKQLKKLYFVPKQKN